MKTSLILACAGIGARAKQNKNKLLAVVGGKTVLESTLYCFTKTKLIDEYIIVVNSADKEKISSLAPDNAKIVIGGETRTKSIKNALEFVSGNIVLIHDGARPFVSQKMIEDCINLAKEKGSAIPLIPQRDTIAKASGGIVQTYLGKEDIYNIQTPQGFDSKSIKKAYLLAEDKTFNDDGEVYKTYIGNLFYYFGEETNKKLTYPSDFSQQETVRFGTGFDCHKLVENRKLILGGVEIEHFKGLLGHSDADVLTHAIMDAILSGLALSDIGHLFPDTDPKYKDANSIELLKQVLDLIDKKGYKVESLSASIMAEKPKLQKHILSIRQNLANVIKIDIEKVGIGATTLEGLGFVGREEGICTHATVVLAKI